MVLWGFALLIFGLNTIAERAAIVVDGTIVSRETQCEQDNKSRCTTTYTLQSPRSQFKSYFGAQSNDQSLPLYFPDGTKIRKQKGKLSYEINGREVNDFPLIFYLLCALIGTALVFGSFAAFILITRSIFRQPVSRKSEVNNS